MSSSSDSSDKIEQLQQAVSKLRAEAQAAEEVLRSRGKQEEEYTKPIEYTDLKDSCWEIT